MVAATSFESRRQVSDDVAPTLATGNFVVVRFFQTWRCNQLPRITLGCDVWYVAERGSDRYHSLRNSRRTYDSNHSLNTIESHNIWSRCHRVHAVHKQQLVVKSPAGFHLFPGCFRDLRAFPLTVSKFWSRWNYLVSSQMLGFASHVLVGRTHEKRSSRNDLEVSENVLISFKIITRFAHTVLPRIAAKHKQASQSALERVQCRMSCGGCRSRLVINSTQRKAASCHNCAAFPRIWDERPGLLVVVGRNLIFEQDENPLQNAAASHLAASVETFENQVLL